MVHHAFVLIWFISNPLLSDLFQTFISSICIHNGFVLVYTHKDFQTVHPIVLPAFLLGPRVDFALVWVATFLPLPALHNFALVLVMVFSFEYLIYFVSAHAWGGISRWLWVGKAAWWEYSCWVRLAIYGVEYNMNSTVMFHWQIIIKINLELLLLQSFLSICILGMLILLVLCTRRVSKVYLLLRMFFKSFIWVQGSISFKSG